jgi:Arc/MetJ family transcription regulator
MLKRFEVLIEESLVRGVINKYHLADTREAVHLALKALLDDAAEVEHEPGDEDYDEFTDLSAWRLHRSSDPG